MFLYTFGRLFLQFFLDIFYFPVWWYSTGVLRILDTGRAMIREGNDQFVPFLWMRYVFVPMFGQYDWQGRIMSFFMRVVNIIFRLLFLAIWSVFVCLILLVWLFAPLVVTTLCMLAIF